MVPRLPSAIDADEPTKLIGAGIVRASRPPYAAVLPMFVTSTVVWNEEPGLSAVGEKATVLTIRFGICGFPDT